MRLWIEEIHQLVDWFFPLPHLLTLNTVDSYQYLLVQDCFHPPYWTLCGWTICRTEKHRLVFRSPPSNWSSSDAPSRVWMLFSRRRWKWGRGSWEFLMEDRGEHHLQNVVSVVFWSFLVLSCKIWPLQMYPNVKWHGAAINALGIREKQVGYRDSAAFKMSAAHMEVWKQLQTVELDCCGFYYVSESKSVAVDIHCIYKRCKHLIM